MTCSREREATFVPLGQWFHGWLRRLRDECGNVRVKELSGAVTGCIVVLHCVVLRQRHAVLRVAHRRVCHLRSSEHQRLAGPPQTTCRELPVSAQNLLLSTRQRTDEAARSWPGVSASRGCPSEDKPPAELGTTNNEAAMS